MIPCPYKTLATLKLAWLNGTVSETMFCYWASHFLHCTEGEVLDMIDNFEV